METTIIAVVAGLALASTGFRWRRRLRRANERATTTRTATFKQSRNIRILARRTLAQRRELRALARVTAELAAACEALQAQLAGSSQIDRRLHVLDDRRTRADQEWIAVVRHQDYDTVVVPDATSFATQCWRHGYRFLVWAVDRDRAYDKLNAAMPADRGFHVVSLDRAPPPAPAKQPPGEP